MEQDRRDSLSRSLNRVPSRRDHLRGIAAAIALMVPSFSGATAAKKNNQRNQRKNRKQKLQRNAFACVDVGLPCAGNSLNCCSGVCQGSKPKKGKKDTSFCVAHNTGVCSAITDSCTAGASVPCNPTNPNCFCTLTTGNAGFCAAFNEGTEGHCRVCSKDTDCQAEFGPGAACVVLRGICTPLCVTTGTTACAPPCA